MLEKKKIDLTLKKVKGWNIQQFLGLSDLALLENFSSLLPFGVGNIVVHSHSIHTICMGVKLQLHCTNGVNKILPAVCILFLVVS